ncbi:CLUMA_CG001045, isoform A [Clunio marinus]|uniref:CLUMA_CG001045, isoform A n=1 Tax=Clunio marinus TaxID=568069 RepID=A0A1J1HH90_9DIPT|nr:CLUMA_CG001045, isoform A [Clunio marinus]
MALLYILFDNNKSTSSSYLSTSCCSSMLKFWAKTFLSASATLVSVLRCLQMTQLDLIAFCICPARDGKHLTVQPETTDREHFEKLNVWSKTARSVENKEAWKEKAKTFIFATLSVDFNMNSLNYEI